MIGWGLMGLGLGSVEGLLRAIALEDCGSDSSPDWLAGSSADCFSRAFIWLIFTHWSITASRSPRRDSPCSA